MLKIDRTDPKELIIEDDKVEYSHDEIYSLINVIDGNNRQATGSPKIISAFGIVGKVKLKIVV